MTAPPFSTTSATPSAADGSRVPPEPPDLAEVVFQTALLSLRRTLRGRRWILAAVFVAAPAGLAWLVTRKALAPDALTGVFFGILSFMHFGIAVPAVALSFSTSFPWQDADEGSLVWWFSAPVSRRAVHLGRFVAALVFGLVLLPVSILLLRLTVPLPDAPWTGDVTRAAVAATLLAYPAYAGIFWCANTWTRRGLVVGIVFVLVENFLQVIEGNVARLTVVFYVRSSVHPSVPEQIRGVSAGFRDVYEPVAPGTATLVLGSVALLTLGLSLWLVQHVEYRGKTSQAA